MLYILNGKSWKHLPLLFLVLLMAVPAFGQSSTLGRLVIDTSQSEYATPSPDRNVICPVCEEAGKKSTVRRWTEPTTYGFSINYYQSEDRYWDEDGRYHDHELAPGTPRLFRGSSVLGLRRSPLLVRMAEWSVHGRR